METEALFEFTCPECEKGTVRTTRIYNYKTKIKGYPFTVDEALIGVCDECGAQSFAPEETKRWDELFSHSLQARHAFLTPEEITQIRKSLGLSMEDFARLIGSTRQSVSMWEKTSRTTPPVRTADLLMKLVRQSLSGEPVDVLPFLLDEGRKWGVTMELRSWMTRLEAAREKYEQLEHLSSIISPIAPNIWEEVQETIETKTATTQNLKLPVLFFLLDRRKMKNLQSLNQFLGRLRKSRNKKHQEECRQLAYRLQERTGDGYKTAAGALFETDILIRLLEKNSEGSVCMYPQIQNGNYPDASFGLGKKTVYLEATILSQTEDQGRVWDKAREKMNPSQREMEDLGLLTVRHHRQVSTATGIGDPYGDAHRFTRKIKKKQEQLEPQAPNILCIGLPDVDPNPLNLVLGVKPLFSEALQSAQWLTGILVFRWEQSDFRPEKHFWNPSPHPDSQLSPTEQKTILDWFGFSKESPAVENEKPEIFRRDGVEAAKRERIEELARSEIVKNDRSNMTAEETARVVQEAYGRARDMADKEFSDNE